MTPARKLITTSTVALLLTLTGCTSDDPAAGTDLASAPDDSTPSDTSDSTDGPIDLVDLVGALEPGTYSLAVWGETQANPLPRAIVEVPEGYFSNGGYVIDAGHAAQDPEEFGVVQVWRVDQVLADPCRRRTAADAGPTVDDLARALGRQSGPSTRPDPVVLDGHPGLAMEVTVPTTTDLTECPDGYYPLWMAKPDQYQSHSDPGVVHHLWILDVDGTRLVVVASTYPDQNPGQDEELIAMAESIHFVAPSS